MPTEPIHADHIQPTEVPWLLEVMRTTHLYVTLETPADVTARRWIAPCDGMIENVRFKLDTCGTVSGATTADIEVNGSSILATAMSIAHDDADGTEVFGTFTLAADAEINQSDVVTVEVTTTATGPAGGHVNLDFVALGRSA